MTGVQLNASSVPDLLFDLLKQMDDEAAPNYLEEYATFRGKKNWEVSWSTRLAELLNERSILTKPEEQYPGGTKNRCDLVINVSGGRFWIELKGLWKLFAMKHYAPRATAVNHYYYTLFWPEQPTNRRVYSKKGKSGVKHNTAMTDIAKLSTLGHAVAAFVGILLIGFDGSEAECDMAVQDIPEFTRLGNLSEWCEANCCWPNRRHPEELARVQCFFWWKQVEDRSS